MKRWQVPLIVGALALPVYGGAISNGWTFDDNLIVRRNAAAHSLGAAWNAALSPYWPVTDAGQYRPLVVWTYGVDWMISGGNPAWFHGMNVVLHAVASVLLAVVVLRWLPPIGAAVTGVVFAWHPVHVEAVANVVGRAELMAAIGLLATVLAARRFRAAAVPAHRWAWGVVALGCVLVALLSKEHGVVAVALIAADEALERRNTWRTSAPLYVACAALTAAWFHTWWVVAGRLVPEVVAAPLADLSWSERLATMLPVQLDVVRLLTWPSNLAADYNPLLVPQRHEFTVLALVGLITVSAMLVLAISVVRRAPVITFGIVLATCTYAPTSNLVFASGVPLAERNLYLAVAMTGAVIGWLVSTAADRRMQMGALVAAGTLAGVYATRSISRVPFWMDDETAIIDEFVSHPQNYRNHLRVASLFVGRGDTLAAIAQGMVAARLFPADPWVAWRVVPWALAADWHGLARAEALRAADARPDEPAFQRLVARAYLNLGWPDSAVAPARRAVNAAPDSPVVRRWYIEVLDSLDAAPWRTAVEEAYLDWIEGRISVATRRLANAVGDLSANREAGDCWDVETAGRLLVRLDARSAETGATPAVDRTGCEELQEGGHP